MPVSDPKSEQFIKQRVGTIIYYSQKTIKVHFKEENVCLIESLHIHILNEAIKNDLILRSTKQLHKMYKYFKKVFPDMNSYDFQAALYDINARFNRSITHKYAIRVYTEIDKEYNCKDCVISIKDGFLKVFFNNTEFNTYIKTIYEALVHTNLQEPVYVNVFDLTTYKNNRLSINIDDIEGVLRTHPDFEELDGKPPNNTYKVFENTIQLFIKKHKVIIHKGKTLRMSFYNMSELSYLKTLDYIQNSILSKVVIKSLDIFTDKTDVKDCQDKRQGEMHLDLGFDLQAETEMYVGLNKIFKCTGESYKFPGYTRKGVPCCFSSEQKDFKFGKQIKGQYSFHPVSTANNTLESYLQKEEMTKKLRKNVYIIDWHSGKLQSSNYCYDIYDTSIILLFNDMYSDLYILKDSKGNENLRTSDVHKFGYTYDYPKFTGIKWIKDYIVSKGMLTFRKYYKSEVIDAFGNTIFLERADGVLVPIVPQPYLGILDSSTLYKINEEVLPLQEKFLSESGIDYTIVKEKGYILLKKLGITIPISDPFVDKLSTIELEIKENLI